MFTMIGQLLSLDGLTITIAEFYEIVRGHIGKAKWPFVFFYRKHCAQNVLYFLYFSGLCSAWTILGLM